MTDDNPTPVPTALDESEQRHHRGNCLALAVEVHKEDASTADSIVASATAFANFVLGVTETKAAVA